MDSRHLKIGRHLSNQGFTLIELVITVAIVAILSTVLLPISEVAIQRSKEQDLRAALRQIRSAIDAYKQASDDGRIARQTDQSGYPPSLIALVAGVTDAKDPKGGKIYFLRKLPRDPMATDPHLPDIDTWAARSYTSPPEDPQPGKDVFDIHSRSVGKGLNGIPYQEW